MMQSNSASAQDTKHLMGTEYNIKWRHSGKIPYAEYDEDHSSFPVAWPID